MLRDGKGECDKGNEMEGGNRDMGNQEQWVGLWESGWEIRRKGWEGWSGIFMQLFITAGGL